MRRRRKDSDSEEDTPRKKKEKFGSFGNNVKANNKSLVGRIMESSGDTEAALSSEI